MIACSLASVLRGDFNAFYFYRIACPSATPYLLAGQSSRSIKELEYSLTLRPLDTNAANIVAINRYQYLRLLPARVVSAYSAPTMLAIFSPCFYRAFALAQSLNLLVLSFLIVGPNLNSFLRSLWVSSQESSTRRRDKRREELSARAPFFFVNGGGIN